MQVYKIVPFSVALLLVTVLFAGVMTAPSAAQSTPLAITSVDPTNNTVNVPVTKTINVTFNETVQQGTNYSNIELERGAIKVNTTISIAGDTLTIKSNATLAYNTSYTAFIPKDGAKNGTATATSDFTSHFTTVAAPNNGSTLNVTANAKSNVVSASVTKQPTQLTLTASNTAPTVNQSVTFKATLTPVGGTPIPEPVTIYHYLNGVRYNDITAYSTLTFATKWTTPGVRTYYASFAGDSAYQASTSSVVTINVTTPLSGNPTHLTLTASNTTPVVNQSVTFNATLSSSGTALPSEPVTIYHYLNGVRYNDTTNTTNANGQITITTSFGSPGTRSYYASFAGDGSYQASTSSVVTINVDAQTNVTLTASNTAPAVNQSVTFTATLSWWNPATSQWVAVTTSSEPIQIWHTLNGVRYNDTTINTNSSGTATFTQKWTSAGTRSYYATFAGDTWYKTFTSSAVTVNVQTNTQTIYYVPQAGSTWVNQGTAGASYNAYVSNPGSFQTQSNGYPYWGDDTSSDFVCIPAGSATNNQNVVSWEIGFHFAGVVAGQRYQKIWDKACGGFMIEIDTALGASHSELTIYRATTGGSGARWYIPTDTVLRAGHNYYVQISWNTSAGPGNEPYPTVWIGEDGNAPVHQTHFDESGNALGGTGSWYNDSVGSANLGNTASDAPGNASAKTAWLDGGFFVYRQYNSILNFSTGGSWNTDELRWT